MFEWLNLFPPYLVVFTVLLVILPSIIGFGIRITLYQYLQNSVKKVQRLITGSNRGIQPAIVEKLERRFQQASHQLESVNTSALIDGIYSEEKFLFFSQSLRCEQWDYFTRVLPNLLLAFGLLGTFLGITLNLTNISEIIHQGSVNGDNLVENLQTPLQSMGIAFITSLIALVFSSILTVTNLRYNISLAKDCLISSLEDYLDNIFQPTIEGNSRLDKAVNRMVEQQNEFLMRFHDNVTKAVESSLGRVAQQIADGNIEATKLARQVYERFTETSGTLARGADVFQQSTVVLQNHVNSLHEIVQHKNFVEYSKTLQGSAKIFREASQKIEQSQFADKLSNASTNLMTAHNQFADSTSVLNQSIQSIKSVIQDFKQSIQQMIDLGSQISNLNQQSAQIIELNQKQLIIEEESLTNIQSELVNLMQTVTNYQQQANSGLDSLRNNLINSIDYYLENNNQKLQQVSLTIEQYVTSIREIQSELTHLVNAVNTQTDESKSWLAKLSNWMVQINGNNQQQIQLISQNLEQIQSELSQLRELRRQQLDEIVLNGYNKQL